MGVARRYLVKLLCSDQLQHLPFHVKTVHVFAENIEDAKRKADRELCVPMHADEI